jgi:integrase
MALKIKNETYYVVFRDFRGRVNSRSLKTKDYNQAVMYHDLFVQQLQSARQKQVIIKEFPLIIPQVNDFADRLEKTAKNRLKLKNMIDIAKSKRELSQKHISTMNYFVDRIKNICHYADEVTPKIAQDYLNKYYNKGNGKNYNNIKSCLNTVFRCCLVEANLSSSPFQPIINKKVTEIDTHRNLTDTEIDTIMSVLPLPMQVMTMLSRWTAQRLETCARMTPSMFDFEARLFIIEPSKTKRFNKFVCVPIMQELQEFIEPILEKCKDKEKPIIKQITDLKYPNYYISDLFRQALIKCNIPINSDNGKAGFHSLRGSAITYFKELGMSSDDLRLITGHTTDRMEQFYDRSKKQLQKYLK